MLIGLDCVPPALAFERYREHMPHLSSLMARGAWAPLRSTMPPITVPAWTCMVSGRDPGELGIYGFRKRKAEGYGMALAQSGDVTEERLWDVLARHDKRSSVLFVPPSYPPFKVHGELVSCFLTPDAEHAHTYPAPLSGELRARFGPYVPDVEVRMAEREGLCEALIAMTRQHFSIARHVWTTREPDFLMMVEIGPDRLHHAFFAEMDPAHPRHDPQSPHARVGELYYRALDEELGALMALADDDTALVIASDHGARPLRSAFTVNAWLMAQGYLHLREPVAAPTPLRPELVDWSKTRAWAEGGYYARVFLNLRGREPQGIVDASAAPALREELARGLSAVRGPNGEPWLNHVHTPEALYGAVRGHAPDLLAVFDDLNVRALSTVGQASAYAEGDDRGADACNHDWLGIFVVGGAGVTARGALAECSIYDVGATVLTLFGVPLPAGWRGRDRSAA